MRRNPQVFTHAAVGGEDGLTGVSQSMTYDVTPGDGGIGQVSQVAQGATTAGTGAYNVSYNYSPHGDRTFATYATPSDTTLWQYADFVQVGQATDDKMAFQTLLKATGTPANPSPTAEEEDYAYDTSGRIQNAAFAQTPSPAARGLRGSAGIPRARSRHRAAGSFSTSTLRGGVSDGSPLWTHIKCEGRLRQPSPCPLPSKGEEGPCHMGDRRRLT